MFLIKGITFPGSGGDAENGRQWLWYWEMIKICWYSEVAGARKSGLEPTASSPLAHRSFAAAVSAFPVLPLGPRPVLGFAG